MWNHTTILHAKRIAMGLNCNEYCILDLIAHKQQYRRAQGGVRMDVMGEQWCDTSDTRIAEALELSRMQVSRICKKLCERGYLTQVSISKAHKIKKATEKYFLVMELDFTKKNAKELRGLLDNIKAEDFDKKRSKTIKTVHDFVQIKHDESNIEVQQNVTQGCNKMLHKGVTKCYTNSKDIISTSKDISFSKEKEDKSSSKAARPKKPNLVWPVIKAWREMYKDLTNTDYELKWLKGKEEGHLKQLSKKFREKSFQGTEDEMYEKAKEFFASIAALYRRGDFFYLNEVPKLMPSLLNANSAKIIAQIKFDNPSQPRVGEIESRFDGLDEI